MGRIKAMWPAVLAVAACAFLASPASAADSEPSTIVPGPGCSTVYPGGHELCGEITLQGGGKIHYYFELGTNGVEYDTQVPPAPGTELVITPEEPSVTVHEPLEMGRLAPNTTYYYRLAILDNEGPRYSQPAVFTTPVVQAADPPTIESTSVTGLTETDATLEADIDTGGLDTTYQFRLAYGCGFRAEVCPQYCISGQPCPGPWNGVFPVALPSGDLPASTDVQHVSLDLNSVGVTLQPYKYRYSIEATNDQGTDEGPAQFFTPHSPPPPSSDGAPSIESELATSVTPDDATLVAEIDPNGFETVYELQIDTTGNFKFFQTSGCPMNVPETGCTTEVVAGDPLAPGLVQPPEYSLPAADGPQHVSVNMAAIGATLQPGTTYHYRAIAANRNGYAYGSDQTFTTPASPGDLPEAPVTEACTGPIVAGSGQKFCGTLNPGSSAKVGYYFEVREGSSCVGGTHFEGSSEVEGEGVAVSTAVKSLAPDTVYTVCLVATNSAGETRGQGLTFATPAPPPPSLWIESESVSGVSSTDATLEAQINTYGLETAYKLQIDTTGNFRFYQTDGCALHLPDMGCTQAIVPGDPLPPGLVEPPEVLLSVGDEVQHVSANLASIGAVLKPGTTYHYRAIALNRTGYAYGPDQTFTTPSSDSPDTTPPGPPPDSSAGQLSLPAVNPAPSVSHPRRGKHKRHRHRRHKGSARSTRAVRR